MLIFSAAMLIGLVGVVFPVVPGIPLMFLIALVFGFIDDFVHLVWWELLILFGMMLISLVIDHAAGILGARYGGANRRSILAGVIGLVIGLFVFPPFGGLIGLFLGVLAAELLQMKETVQAVKAATGGLIGYVAGVLANLMLGLVFIGLFVLFALR